MPADTTPTPTPPAPDEPARGEGRTFGQRVLALMDARGESYRDVAGQIGYTASALFKICTDNADPRLSTARAIARHFGVTLDALVREDEPAPSPAAVRKAVRQDARAAAAVGALLECVRHHFGVQPLIWEDGKAAQKDMRRRAAKALASLVEES